MNVNNYKTLEEEQPVLTGIPSSDKPWLKWYSKEAIEAIIPQTTTYEYMCEQNKNNLNKVALNYMGSKITYRQLIENIEKTVTMLVNLGIRPGEIVTFCTPTIPETIYLFYALNKMGVVAAMIDPTTNNERIENFINVFGSKYLVMVDLAYPKLDKVVRNTKVEKVITISPADSLSPIMQLGYKAKNFISEVKKESKKLQIPFGDYYLSWSSLKKLDNGIRFDTVENSKDKPAAIVLTSGTTGIPKGAVLTNENLNAIALEQGYCTNMAKNDTFLNIMPPFIAYGLVCGINNVLCNGLEMVIIPKLEKRSQNDFVKADEPKLEKGNMFDSLIVKHHPQHVLGVPNFYLRLLESESLKDQELSFLKCCIAGGETFHSYNEELVNSFLQAHRSEITMSKGYGMTELSSVATYTTRDEVNKSGSVGIPVMFNNVKILDIETKKELGYNQRGELYMTGPGVILGYFGNDDETKKTFVTDDQGIRWVKTGDIFSMDEDGVLFFHGRIKRMMIRSDGHNVFNQEIEDAILLHEAVKECSVIGVLDEKENGEKPTAIVVLLEKYKGQEKIVRQQLVELLEDKLPSRDVAQGYIFRDCLPMTMVGKVDYRKLEEEAKVLHLKK